MHKNKSVSNFLINSCKPFKFYISLHLLVVIYNAIDISLWPYVSKVLINTVSESAPEDVIQNALPVTILLIILTILPGLIWRIADFSWLKITPLMKKKITIETLDYVTQHSSNFFQNNFSGSIANKIRDLSNSTPKILDVILYNFLNVILSLTIALFTLFSVHKFFAFALIFWAIIFIFMALKGARATGKMSIDIANQSSKIMGNIVDVITNIFNLKFFCRHKFEEKRMEKVCDEYTTLSQRRSWFLLKFYTLHGFTFSAYFVFCIGTLVWLYSKSLVTIGDFAMIFTINSWMIHAMWMAANELRTFLEDIGTVKQALEIIDKPLEITDKADAKNLVIHEQAPGEIIFDNVEFAYKNSAPIFSDKSVTIKSGQKVGLVGHSGGGKTTFVNLILRSFDVTKGRILIDGQNISEVSQDSLRTAIAMIPQDPTLFHRSIFENIAYGKINTSQEEVIEASKKAHAHDFIEKLPNKYESLVGERGVKLSGGQRQRIAIARAFLKNSPILILDEATSQLDSITENLIQESLQNLMKGKTVIAIAHRLSTLQNMDRLLVFDGGKIVEDGTHAELLKLNGKYKKLWDSQVGGFLIDE